MKTMKLLTGMLLVLMAGMVYGNAQNTPPAAAKNTVADAKSAPDAKSSSDAPIAPFGTRYPRYKIGSGDSFDVSFELSPEFNQTVTVQPDGFVTLRGVGDVNVAGQTVPELGQTLKTAYGKILNDPQIVIMLKDFEKPYFIADGQVGHPGKYDLRGDVTVTEAVAVAGGFTDAAKHSQVLLFRRISDEWTDAKVINVKKMLKDGNLHEDMHLHPGDMIVVPKNTLSKIQKYIPNTSVGAYTQFPIP